MTDKIQNALQKVAKLENLDGQEFDQAMVNGALIGTGVGGVAGGLLGYLSSRDRESVSKKLGRIVLYGLTGAGTGFVGGAFGGPYFVDSLIGLRPKTRYDK